MKRLATPTLDTTQVYDACVSGIVNSALAQRFVAARDQVIANFNEYSRRAKIHQLFSFSASAWGNDMQQVLGDLTKKDFVDLYSKQMVSEGLPGRTYYDRLMMLAPLGKCPYCGFGQASTLDHFLSKARYPAFSVLSTNLVPACTDCNKGKSAAIVASDTQILHPYFESEAVETEPWLFAEVLESTPPTVRFFVQTPAPWPEDLRLRVSNYFRDLELARRFAVEAAAEIAGLAELLDELGGQDSRRQHLSTVARIERRSRKNSWKAALFEALAASNWFQSTGYRTQTAVLP